MERLHWAAHPIDAFHGIYRRWKPKSSVNEAELQASIDSLEDTGIIDDPVKEPDKKPRPLHRWILIGLFMFVVIALAVSLGVYFGLRNRNKHGDSNGAGSNNTSSNNTSSNNTEQGQILRIKKDSILGPVMDFDFPDPCYISVDNIHYAFATNARPFSNATHYNIQIATSKDFKTWEFLSKDALPDAGPWTTGRDVWAPDVVQLDNGNFVLYYTAQYSKSQRHHCIGAATSKTVDGPYKPMNQSLICPLSEGGAIDPEGFRDKDGSHYLLYKIDGNSLNAGNDSLHSTPIMLQPVKSDGISLLDKPTALLDRGPEDGPLIEAPAMARYERAGDKGDLYVLYYSSNMYDAPSYDIGYATSDGGVKGPFNKSTARLLMTGDADGKLIGPGGMDVGIGNGKVTFHSILSKDPLKRTMWTGYISFNEAR